MPKYKSLSTTRPYDPYKFLGQEKVFLSTIIIGFTLAAFFAGSGAPAMWLGFFFAAYAAVANDSIQSLGTFIDSNGHRKWWVLWLYIGAIFLAVISVSWWYFDGDVTYQRLLSDDGVTKYPH